MAFALPPTLSEVRRAVAIRLNRGAQAEQSPVYRDKLTQYVLQAVSELWSRYPWIISKVRFPVALIDGQSTYDWPDNMEVGRLERLIIVDKDGGESILDPDIRPYERANLTSGDNPSSLPLRYEIINQEIVMYPPPLAETYPTMLVEGFMTPAEPVNNDDRIPMNKEALLQWATAVGKADERKSDAVMSMANAVQFIDRLRTMQSDGSSIRIGGGFSQKFAYNSPRRTPQANARANYWLYED